MDLDGVMGFTRGSASSLVPHLLSCKAECKRSVSMGSIASHRSALQFVWHLQGLNGGVLIQLSYRKGSKEIIIGSKRL